MITKALQKSLAGSFFGWKKPVHLIFHVTSRCNARCGMCFAWQRLNKEKDLSLKEIEELAQTLSGLIFLDLSGGEPFLRDDLPEILAIFEKYSPQAYVNLPTNGLLSAKIEKKTKEILKRTRLPVSLSLSLDGLGKTHDEIRGVKGGFNKVLQSYQKLARMQKGQSQLSLRVSTVVSNQNWKQLPELAKFIKQEMELIEFHTLIFIRGEPKDKRFALPPLKELEKKKDLFFNIWRYYPGHGQNLGPLGSKIANRSHEYLFGLYLKTLREEKMPLPCLAGKAHAVVFAGGDLAFCELLPPVGNLRKAFFDFNRLWFSEEAQAQRRRIKRGCCFCTHGCVWVDNLFLNPRAYPQILKQFLTIKTGCN